MNDDPVLLIQWLTDPNDGQEVAAAFARHKDRFYIKAFAARSKEEVRKAILEWAECNPCAQGIYIGCHGFLDRLGPTSQFPSDEEGVTFVELWAWLQDAQRLHRTALLEDKIQRFELLEGDQLDPEEGLFDIWLGACRSANVVNCWTPLAEMSQPWPVQAIIGFEEPATSSQVATFLDLILSMQTIDPINFPEDVWMNLLQQLPGNRPVVFGLDEDEDGPKWARAYGY